MSNKHFYRGICFRVLLLLPITAVSKWHLTVSLPDRDGGFILGVCAQHSRLPWHSDAPEIPIRHAIIDTFSVTLAVPFPVALAVPLANQFTRGFSLARGNSFAFAKCVWHAPFQCIAVALHDGALIVTEFCPNRTGFKVGGRVCFFSVETVCRDWVSAHPRFGHYTAKSRRLPAHAHAP